MQKKGRENSSRENKEESVITFTCPSRGVREGGSGEETRGGRGEER